MLRWLHRRREQGERIEAEADALISDLGDGTYVEARRRECEANSDEMEREWRRIALAIARKTGKSVGLDTDTRKAADADISILDDGTTPRTEPQQDIDPLDELMRIVSETPARPPYRIQFVGGEGERGTSILKEVGLNCSNRPDPFGRLPASDGLHGRSASG
jgi:hypothetical protein